jgi:hypothetical protein
MLLLPEEAKLLLEKGICQLIQYPELKEIPCESLKKKFEEYRSKLFTEQQDCLIDQRRMQVISFSRINQYLYNEIKDLKLLLRYYL